MSEKLYKNANPNGQGFDATTAAEAGVNTDSNANNDGNVYDADYKVEDDNK